MTHEQDSTPTLVSIYALCDPDTGEVRYIGQTRDPKGRLRGHVGGARYAAGPHAAWIESLRERELVPLMRVLEVVSADLADEIERRQIAAHRARGCQLTNRLHNHEQNPRQRGRTCGPPMLKYTVLLPEDLGEWGKDQPEGLSALLRALLESERRRRVA